MIYTSIENAKMKDLKKLHMKKYRDREGLFLVEGEHLVEEAYHAGILKTIIIEENHDYDYAVEKMYVSQAVLKFLSELETPQPVMGVCEKPVFQTLQGNILVLEDIQDPGNLGTMIRSAVAFHMGGIVVSLNTVDPYNEKVLRASQGLLFHIPLIVGDLKEILPTLKAQQYHILGTKVTHGKNIKSIEKNGLFAIIMGNEGKGMSEQIGEFCDDFVYIDMSDECESLNVGVAASILMYELDK